MTEDVVFVLQLGGDLEARAKRASAEVRDLGDQAQKTKKEVAEVGDVSERASSVVERAASLMGGAFGDMSDVVLDLGGRVKDLVEALGPGTGTVVGFAGVAAAGAVGAVALAGALSQVAQRAIEARDHLREVGVQLDTPGLDDYQVALSDFDLAWSNLWVTIGEGLAGPLTKLTEWVTTGIDYWRTFQRVVSETRDALGNGWGSTAAATALSGLAYATGYATGERPYDVFGPSPDLAPPAASGAWSVYGPSSDLAPMNVHPTAGKSASQLAWEAYQRGAPGQSVSVPLPPSTLDQWRAGGDAFLAQAESVQPRSPALTDAASTGISSALSGGGIAGALGPALSAAGPYGAIGAAAFSLVASGKVPETLTDLVDQTTAIFTDMPDMAVRVFEQVLPHLIEQLPDAIAYGLVLATGAPFITAIVGSLDELGRSIVDALLDLPAAFARALKDTVNPLGDLNLGGLFGGKDRPVRLGARAAGHKLDGVQNRYNELRREQGSYGRGYTVDPLVP